MPLSPLTSLGAQRSAITNTEKLIGPIANAFKSDDMSLPYIFTQMESNSVFEALSILTLEFSTLNLPSVLVSVHSMQVAASATFCKLKRFLEAKVPLKLVSPGSSSPGLIKDASDEEVLHFIILPDVSGYSHNQGFRENYRHFMILWEEPHVLIGRDLGRKSKLAVTGMGATGDFLRINKFKKVSYENRPVPEQKARVIND